MVSLIFVTTSGQRTVLPLASLPSSVERRDGHTSEYGIGRRLETSA